MPETTHSDLEAAKKIESAEMQEHISEVGTKADAAAEYMIKPKAESVDTTAVAAKTAEVKQGFFAKLKDKLFGETEQEKMIRERKEALLLQVRNINPEAYDRFVKKNGGPAKYMKYDPTSGEFIDSTVYGTTVGSSSEQQIKS